MSCDRLYLSPQALFNSAHNRRSKSIFGAQLPLTVSSFQLPKFLAKDSVTMKCFSDRSLVSSFQGVEVYQ